MSYLTGPPSLPTQAEIATADGPSDNGDWGVPALQGDANDVTKKIAEELLAARGTSGDLPARLAGVDAQLAATATKAYVDSIRAVSGQRPLMIKHGAWYDGCPNEAQVTASGRWADMQASPFDGWVVQVRGNTADSYNGGAGHWGTGDAYMSSYLMHPTAVMPYSQIASALSGIKALGINTGYTRHNFALVRMYRYNDPAATADGGLPWWNAAYATFVTQKFRNFALAAREAGFKGLFIDTEPYFPDTDSPWLLWRRGAGNAHTLQQTRDAVRAFAKKIATAVLEEWPDCVMMTTFGPWVSDEDIDGNTGAAFNGFYDTIANGVDGDKTQGSFCIGLLEAVVATGRGKYVDGGELYEIRNAAQAAASYAWRKDSTAGGGFATRSSICPAELKASYRGSVSVAAAVYDSNYSAGAVPWQGLFSSQVVDTWTYETSTASPPTTGKVRFSNALLTTASMTIRIHGTSLTAVDRETVLKTMVPKTTTAGPSGTDTEYGDFIRLSDGTNYATYHLASAWTDNGAWLSATVEYVASKSSNPAGLTNAETVTVSIERNDPRPPRWTERIGLAMDYTDEYVWIYTERFAWAGGGWNASGWPVPAAWVTATEAARRFTKGT